MTSTVSQMHLVDVNVRLGWCDTSAKIASLRSCIVFKKLAIPGASAKVSTRHVSRLRIYGGGEEGQLSTA